jgi:beta-aspartyl-peptidase (threonine type)
MSKTPGIVVGSENARVGIAPAVEVLRAGGTVVEAVVAGIRPVEANPEDHSVGYSGLPNLLGEVELDASIMDGATLAAGAVGALHGHQDAIGLARRVMEDLPHVMVVGAGADRLAQEADVPAVELLTPEAERIWKDRFERDGSLGGVHDSYMEQIRGLVRGMARDPEQAGDVHGTVNVIARDRAGNVACGVSTSGFAWKYPGRLGDSPIIGAGNYADNRWGGAACTGHGEMAIRCCTAHSVVTFMRFGLPLEEALRMAMADLRNLGGGSGEMHIVALDRDGNHAGISSRLGKTYIYMREDMDTYAEVERLHVPL